jgi:hypothetical protein
MFFVLSICDKIKHMNITHGFYLLFSIVPSAGAIQYHGANSTLLITDFISFWFVELQVLLL